MGNVTSMHTPKDPPKISKVYFNVIVVKIYLVSLSSLAVAGQGYDPVS